MQSPQNYAMQKNAEDTKNEKMQKIVKHTRSFPGVLPSSRIFFHFATLFTAQHGAYF